MSDLTIFNNEQFGEIRTVTIDGEPWFVLKDICASFGEQNYRRVASRLDEEEKGVSRIDTPGGAQDMTVVNESGVYAALFVMQPNNARNVSDDYIAERTEKLKAFKRWVTHEVLPSIRKTGGYQMQAPQMTQLEVLAATAQALVEQERRMNAIEASVSSMDKKLDNVVDVLSAPKTTEAERWQRETHKAITSFCQENKLSYRDFYDNLYEQLEERAHVNLSSRVTRRQNRARWEGASRTEIYRITKLFMVSIDPKLRIIFDSLVTEFKIAYALKGATI